MANYPYDGIHGHPHQTGYSRSEDDQEFRYLARSFSYVSAVPCFNIVGLKNACNCLVMRSSCPAYRANRTENYLMKQNHRPHHHTTFLCLFLAALFLL